MSSSKHGGKVTQFVFNRAIIKSSEGVTKLNGYLKELEFFNDSPVTVICKLAELINNAYINEDGVNIKSTLTLVRMLDKKLGWDLKDPYFAIEPYIREYFQEYEDVNRLKSQLDRVIIDSHRNSN